MICELDCHDFLMRFLPQENTIYSRWGLLFLELLLIVFTLFGRESQQNCEFSFVSFLSKREIFSLYFTHHILVNILRHYTLISCLDKTFHTSYRGKVRYRGNLKFQNIFKVVLESSGSLKFKVIQQIFSNLIQDTFLDILLQIFSINRQRVNGTKMVLI